MDGFPILQRIIGTDKRNPCLSVCRDEKNRELHVYYGAELFEVVPDDRNDMRFKLMVAHLYTAGVKVKALAEAFAVDPKTMNHWGRALRSGDPKRLAEALAGREGRRKLTPEVEAFVRFRFKAIYAQDRYTYSSIIRAEIGEVFGCKISGETLRPLFGELKVEYFGPGEAPPAAGEPEPEGPEPGGPEPGEAGAGGAGCEVPGHAGGGPRGDGKERDESGDSSGDSPGKDGEAAPANRRPVPEMREPGDAVPCPPGAVATALHFSHHGGVLIFAAVLAQTAETLAGEAGPMARQWLAQILLGAVVIEQSKLLNRGDLKVLLGEMQGTLQVQRQRLGAIATAENTSEVFALNARRCGLPGQRDFYLDPHTHHYTGMRKLLKAWCPGVRLADRAWHADFVHDSGGNPAYVMNNDNYYDLRDRFFVLAEAFRREAGMPEDAELTWVVDRGIYGMETFERVLGEPNMHLITWEKGYARDGWPEAGQAVGSFALERFRNHAEDIQIFQIQYVDEESWSKNAGMRRLIIRVTSPEGRTLEMAILADDKNRAAEGIIRLMVKRWLQENDFKYMEEHFGIGAITSYAAISYAELAGELEDRQVKSAAYQHLQGRRDGVKKLARRLALDKENAARKGEVRGREMARLEKIAAQPGGLTSEQKKTLSALRGAKKRGATQDEKRQEKIGALLGEIDELEVRMGSTEREVSRLDRLIGEGAERLSGEKKHFMDALKILARNAFYQALAPFKAAYNNFRDDHELFRRLTQSSAVIELGRRGVHCHLLPSPSYPPAVRSIIEKTLDGINAAGPQIPDGSGRPLTLSLARPEGIEFAFANP